MLPRSMIFPYYDEPELPAERGLLAAILERAIRDILNPPDVDGGKDYDNYKHRRDASLWVRADSDEAFGFKWVCSNLDISSNLVRNWIYELERQGVRFELGNGRCVQRSLKPADRPRVRRSAPAISSEAVPEPKMLQDNPEIPTLPLAPSLVPETEYTVLELQISCSPELEL